MFHMAPILNVPRSIREDDTVRCSDHRQYRNDEDDDLIFGALDDDHSSKEKLDQISPSTDEGIGLQLDVERTKKRERTPSSMSTIDDDWENMLPITEGDGVFSFVNQLQSITEKRSYENTVGMSNFHAKHRLIRRAKSQTLVRWKEAARKVIKLKDPWSDFKIDRYPEENVIRHEFDPIKRTWHTSDITIKIESKPFAHGSMRECFRLKKLSVFSAHHDWDHSSNYIAKQYTDEVPTSRYFDDVMMQMTTKLWASHYNQHNPPKKVDIVQMSVLEFKDRAGRPHYHLERFIEGNYIKYNSNSGFVCDDSTLRHTPQAFSHFTFEASCHEQIVVDIQGVGDLYTDPQIHTNLGFEYGEGNLGIRGMTLFFSTHECNPICTRLNLTPFDLSPGELDRHMQHVSSPLYAPKMQAQTACRGSEEPFNGLSMFGSLFRRLRSQSSISEDESDGYVSEASSMTGANAHLVDRSVSVPQNGQLLTTFSDENLPISTSMTKNRGQFLSTSVSLNSPSPNYYSHSHSDLTFNIEDIYNAQTPTSYGNNHRPSSVMLEKAEMEKFQQITACYEKYESILGQIHLEMCKCYQVGRFSELGTEDFDAESALFHLELAAELCVKDAIFTLAKIYLDLPRDLLSHYRPMKQSDLAPKGITLLIRASELQEIEANLYLAQFYDKGIDGALESEWKQAAMYYEKYIQIRENESTNIAEDSETNEPAQTDSTDNGIPFHDRHDIVARLATLYKTGGHNLQCDYKKAGDLFNKAAEMATEAMKGRLATKYYMAAEEAYAMAPDEESESN
ncbi:unnamed protein product [Rotaria magnacalcarata]|nr:unnamed protein product [Rotaria magnacalcarata]